MYAEHKHGQGDSTNNKLWDLKLHKTSIKELNSEFYEKEFGIMCLRFYDYFILTTNLMYLLLQPI